MNGKRPITRRKNYEAWVGLFVVVGVVAVVALVFAVTEPSMLRGRYRVTLRLTDAQGIRRGDPVRMRGVNIGRVRGFSIGSEGVEVNLELEKQYFVPKDSRVEVRSSNILGEMTAEIIPGQSKTNLKGGDVLEGVSTGGLAGQVGNIAAEAGDTLQRLQDLLSEKTLSNIEASSGELVQLLRQLNALATQLREVSHQVDLTTRRVGNVAGGPSAAAAVDNVAQLTLRLDEVATVLEGASGDLASVLDGIQQGHGTLGRLARDDTLYKNANRAMISVNNAAVALTRLLQDVQRRPKRYIHLNIF